MGVGIISHYVAEYETLAPTLAGQNLAWLQHLREDALANFTATGFPSPCDEEWRYTNVSAIEKKLFSPSTRIPKQPIDKVWLQSHQLADTWSVALVNGHFSPEFSNLSTLPQDVIVMSMTDALVKHSSKIENYLSQAVTSQEHGLVAFNTAWFSEGIFIYVPVKQVLAKPIQIVNVVTDNDVMALTRNVIVIAEQAEAQVIETYAGAPNAYLTAAVTEVFVEAYAQLTLYKLQAESDKAYHFGGTYVKEAQNARFIHHNYAFGGLLARCDLHTGLGKAAECELNGLFLGVKRQHLDNHTRIIHTQPHAISREMYKGVLNDRARGVFQGRVIVEEDAQKTDSQMNNRNLLLSPEAEVDTKPQLEIYADDVKCAHGVTVGQLDEKSIFYLQSRCVDEETARNMLTFAFANEMVDKIKIKNLHDLILEHVLARFPQEGVQKEWL